MNNKLKSVSLANYSLLGIIAALVAIHFTALFKSSVETNIISLHFLVFVGIGSLLWDERHNLDLNSTPLASLIGLLLIGWVLIRTISPGGYHIAISPLVFGLGICLLAAGFKSLRFYRKELILLSLIAFYPLVAAFLRMGGITKLTAQISSMMLWVSGYSVHRSGVQIILPRGRVEVLTACAGIDSMLLMLTVTVFLFILVRLKLLDKIICTIAAILISFFLNSFRIAILAVLADAGDRKSFDYWHGGDGSLVFSVLAVMIFAGFCWFFYLRKILNE